MTAAIASFWATLRNQATALARVNATDRIGELPRLVREYRADAEAAYAAALWALDTEYPALRPMVKQAMTGHRELLSGAVVSAADAPLLEIFENAVVASRGEQLAADDPLWTLEQIMHVVGWTSKQTAWNKKLPPTARENHDILPLSEWRVWLAEKSPRAHKKLNQYIVQTSGSSPPLLDLE
jgi:hypothetical protein